MNEMDRTVIKSWAKGLLTKQSVMYTSKTECGLIGFTNIIEYKLFNLITLYKRKCYGSKE